MGSGEGVRVWGCGGEEGVGVHVRCIHTWGVVRVWGCGGGGVHCFCPGL